MHQFYADQSAAPTNRTGTMFPFAVQNVLLLRHGKACTHMPDYNETTQRLGLKYLQESELFCGGQCIQPSDGKPHTYRRQSFFAH